MSSQLNSLWDSVCAAVNHGESVQPAMLETLVLGLREQKRVGVPPTSGCSAAALETVARYLVSCDGKGETSDTETSDFDAAHSESPWDPIDGGIGAGDDDNDDESDPELGAGSSSLHARRRPTRSWHLKLLCTLFQIAGGGANSDGFGGHIGDVGAKIGPRCKQHCVDQLLRRLLSNPVGQGAAASSAISHRRLLIAALGRACADGAARSLGVDRATRAGLACWQYFVEQFHAAHGGDGAVADFPVSSYERARVRSRARKQGLPVAIRALQLFLGASPPTPAYAPFLHHLSMCLASLAFYGLPGAVPPDALFPKLLHLTGGGGAPSEHGERAAAGATGGNGSSSSSWIPSSVLARTVGHKKKVGGGPANGASGGTDALPTYAAAPLLVSGSSASELSASGGSTVVEPSVRTRESALHCLCALVRANPRQMFREWHLVLPMAEGQASSDALVFSLIRPSPGVPARVRTAALGLLACMLDGSRSMLEQLLRSAGSGRDSGGAAPFVSIVDSLSSALHAVLDVLLDCCCGKSEEPVSESAPTFTVLLKCVTLWLGNVPRARLLTEAQRDRLLVLLTARLDCPDNEEEPVQVACVLCAQALFSEPSQQQGHGPGSSAAGDDETSAVAPARSRTPQDAALPALTLDASGLARRLVQRLVVLAGRPDASRLVAGALVALTRIARHCWPLPTDTWKTLQRLVVERLEAPQSSTPPAAAVSIQVACLDFWDQCACIVAGGGAAPCWDAADRADSAVDDGESTAERHLWNMLLSNAGVLRCVEAEGPSVRSALASLLARLSSEVFGQLARPRRIVCVTLLLGLAGDPVASVRSAACRALGVFILFDDLRDDPGFVTDVAEALLGALCRDENLNVRSRAMWSVANLCDALATGSSVTGGGVPVLEALPERILHPAALVSLLGARDHDKVRVNAVRALGNLIRFAPPALLCCPVAQLQGSLLVNAGASIDEIQPSPPPATTSSSASVEDSSCPLLQLALHSVLRSLHAGAVKVRWNACYALGNAMQNQSLPASLYREPWFLATVFAQLTAATQKAKNFKIRINAAHALAQLPRDHACYPPDLLANTLYSLFATVAASSSVAGDGDHEGPARDGGDVDSFKYRQRLDTQLAETLIRVLCIVNVGEDLARAPPSPPPAENDFWAAVNRRLKLTMYARESLVRTLQLRERRQAGAGGDQLAVAKRDLDDCVRALEHWAALVELHLPSSPLLKEIAELLSSK